MGAPIWGPPERPEVANQHRYNTRGKQRLAELHFGHPLPSSFVRSGAYRC